MILRIPILKEKGTKVHELVPIPYLYGEDTVIPDIKPERYIIDENDDIRLISDMISDCYSFPKLFICNLLLHNTFLKPNKCFEGLVAYNTSKYCDHKVIPSKAYFVRISGTALYIYSRKPLKVKINCGQESREEEIKMGKLIKFEEYCEMVEARSDENNDVEILQSNIKLPIFEKIIRIFNKTEENWSSNFEILGKSELENLIILNKTQSLYDIIEEEKKPKSKEPGFFENICSYILMPFKMMGTALKNAIGIIPAKMITFTLSYVILPIILCGLSYTLFKKLITKIICGSP